MALHGWFREPEPALDGPLDLDVAPPALEALRAPWQREKVRLGPFHGQATWRVSIDEQGRVEKVRPVVDNLVGAATGASAPSELVTVGEALIRDATFPAGTGPSGLLLPLW